MSTCICVPLTNGFLPNTRLGLIRRRTVRIRRPSGIRPAWLQDTNPEIKSAHQHTKDKTAHLKQHTSFGVMSSSGHSAKQRGHAQSWKPSPVRMPFLPLEFGSSSPTNCP